MKLFVLCDFIVIIVDGFYGHKHFVHVLWYLIDVGCIRRYLLSTCETASLIKLLCDFDVDRQKSSLIPGESCSCPCAMVTNRGDRAHTSSHVQIDFPGGLRWCKTSHRIEPW
jgi:hypothetical protein